MVKENGSGAQEMFTMLINHNMSVYHQAQVYACNVVFKTTLSKTPETIEKNINEINERLASFGPQSLPRAIINPKTL